MIKFYLATINPFSHYVMVHRQNVEVTNAEWTKRRMGQNAKCQNVEWDKMSNRQNIEWYKTPKRHNVESDKGWMGQNVEWDKLSNRNNIEWDKMSNAKMSNGTKRRMSKPFWTLYVFWFDIAYFRHSELFDVFLWVMIVRQYVVQQYQCSHSVAIKIQKYLHIFFLPYFHSTFCPIRRFFIRRFVPFGVFTFNILSHSVFFHSTFCPIRRFFHSMFFPFDIMYHSAFCPVRR